MTPRDLEPIEDDAPFEEANKPMRPRARAGRETAEADEEMSALDASLRILAQIVLAQAEEMLQEEET